MCYSGLYNTKVFIIVYLRYLRDFRGKYKVSSLHHCTVEHTSMVL